MGTFEVKIADDNNLLVNGEILQANEHSPEYLDSVLKVGREIITQAISDMYDKVRGREEDTTLVERGSVLVMRLGRTTLDVIKRDYYYEHYTELDYSSQGLKPRFKPYFEVVSDNDLIPEIRELAGHKDFAGTNLFVKDVRPRSQA